jgi:hypothetical protein
MEENPYQSPTTVSNATHEVGGFRADGKFLVVESIAVLPPICVKTNRPLTERDMVLKQFTWCSPWWGLLILLSGLLLIVVYFLVRKKCTLTFGLDPSVRRKYRNRALFKVVAAVGLFFALPVVAGTNSTPAIAVVLGLFVFSIVSLLIGNASLSVANYRSGEFWLRGCSKEFLTTIHQTT